MNRVNRALSLAGIGTGAAMVAAAGGAAWYYSSRLIEPPGRDRTSRPVPDDQVRIVAVELRVDGCGTIELDGPGADRPGTWGLRWAADPRGSAAGNGDPNTGYAQIGPPTDPSATAPGDGPVRRPVTVFTGELEPGAAAVLDGYAYPPDPGVLALAWSEVRFTSPVGELPAWEFAGTGDDWVVMVHGRSAGRHESLRMVPTLVGLGLTALVIAYRNDPGAPASPDGRSHLGATEWEDVEAAVAYAVSRGARRVVLVGFSMGGGCVVNLLRLSTTAQAVAAAIIEAPVLDWSPVIRQAAVQRGLPRAALPLLLPASMAVAAARARIDWRAMQHLDDPGVFHLPKLLIQGAEDTTVPVELADALAEARPDIVTYLRVPGAGHVRSWNLDRERYETAVRDFLTRVLTLDPPPA